MVHSSSTSSASYKAEHYEKLREVIEAIFIKHGGDVAYLYHTPDSKSVEVMGVCVLIF